MSTKRRRAEEKRIKGFPKVETDDHPEKTGVLLSDEIKFYVRQGQLIDPFNQKNLKPASYKLTVGDEAVVGGKPYHLSDCWPNNSLSIPAFEVAVIQTAETLNLPRFLIGRWNIRVALAYKGLVWVGGPQVDPGYVGHLFCPIYNLSNKKVSIEKGEAIAVLDFVKTTTFHWVRGKEEWDRYRRPPERLVIEDFEIDDFRSGPLETKDKLDKVDQQIRKFTDEVNQKINLFTSLIFILLAILMSVIALPYFQKGSEQWSSGILDALTIVFSVFAAILSFFSWKSRPNKTTAALLASFGIAAISGAIALCLM